MRNGFSDKIALLFKILFFIFLLLLATKANSQQNPEFLNILPKLPNADPSQIQDIGGLIVYIVNLGYWLVGFALFYSFFRAGIEWFTAAGNLEKIGVARERMLNAVLGFILLLSAWLILNVINPDLLEIKFTIPGI